MARVLLVLSLCLLASTSAFAWNFARYTTTPAPEVNDDDSIVYHERDDIMNGQHITVVFNDNSGDNSDKESSLGFFRVIMDIVMKRAVSEPKAQQNSDRSETTASVMNNEIDGGEHQTSTQNPTVQWTWPWPGYNITTALPATTQGPPHSRCRWCECWEKCRRRRYNWGICLCGKCHCYY